MIILMNLTSKGQIIIFLNIKIHFIFKNAQKKIQTAFFLAWNSEWDDDFKVFNAIFYYKENKEWNGI